MAGGPGADNLAIRTGSVSLVSPQEAAVNRVVARFADGQVVKGRTADFSPTKEFFHLEVASAPAGVKPVKVRTAELKALFFVRDFAGDRDRTDRLEFDQSPPVAGRRIRVVFNDGEVLVGTTTGYQAGRPGFFMVPADAASNNERCYVVAAAIREVGFL
jgi:hypothetical protein